MTPTIEQQYEKLKEEVSQYLDKVYDTIESNEEIKKLCKGWRIIYSPLIQNPTLMFIGINPGSGWEGIDLEHNNKTHLEYLDWDYKLAKDTKEVFAELNALDLLDNSVKTNFFYLITDAEQQMYKITDFLGRGNNDALGEQFFINARRWTETLIEIINPKIIICEGKQAFENITDLFRQGIRMKQNCETLYFDQTDTTIVGYSRTYSIIKDKDCLIDRLKHLLNSER